MKMVIKMNDFNILIKTITRLNVNDELNIDDNIFFADKDIVGIVNKYNLNEVEKNKLYTLALKLCTIYRKTLDSNLIKDDNISIFVFDKIKKYNIDKWNQLCNIIQYHFDNSPKEKKLFKFLNLLDMNNYCNSEYLLTSFIDENDKHYIIESDAIKYSLKSLTTKSDEFNYDYEYYIDQDNYDFIISYIDKLAKKEKKILSKDILGKLPLDKIMTVAECENYIKDVLKRAESSEKTKKVYREDIEDLYKFKSEFIPLVDYVKSLNDSSILVVYTGKDETKPDGFIYYDGKKEIIEITTAGMDEKDKIIKKILNEKGVYTEVEWFDENYTKLVDEIYDKYEKKEKKGYSDRRVLLIYITNDIFWPYAKFTGKDLVNEIKKRIPLNNNFEKIFVIFYDKNGKKIVEKII